MTYKHVCRLILELDLQVCGVSVCVRELTGEKNERDVGFLCLCQVTCICQNE